MRTIHYWVAVTVFGLASPPSAWAAVQVTSSYELVQTMVDYLPPGGPFQVDQDTLERTILPPISMSIRSSLAPLSPDPPVATAAILNVDYAGPLTVGESSPGLTLSADLLTHREGQIQSSGESTAFMELQFTLDQAHPYSFSRVGSFEPGSGRLVLLSQVGGPSIPTGSGFLGPGSYVFQTLSANGQHSFNLTILIPEPTSAWFVLYTALGLRRPLRRRAVMAGS